MDEIKLKLKKIIAATWSLIPQKSLPKGVPVLCYHSVNQVWDDDIEPMHRYLFEQHLAFLTKFYRPVSLSEWIDSIIYGDPLPENAVLITFDDGYQDNYESVFPMILARKIPICIFVVTEFVKGNIKLVENEEFKAISSDQLIKMSDSGLVSFGAHTCTHRILSTLSYDEIQLEVNESIDTLNDWLGYVTKVFAYPFGQYRHVGRDGISVLRDSLAIASFSTHWGVSHSSNDHFFVPRMIMKSSDSVKDLSDKLEGKYGYLGFLHNFSGKIRAHIERLGI